jgi:hypothetical protein
VRLAPIYDTARALLWNTTEPNLQMWETTKSIDQRLDVYIRSSKPKMGWDGGDKLNHFELMKSLSNWKPIYKKVLREMVTPSFLAQSKQLLEGEFYRLFSPLRARIMLKCLEKRVDLFALSIA